MFYYLSIEAKTFGLLDYLLHDEHYHSTALYRTAP